MEPKWRLWLKPDDLGELVYLDALYETVIQGRKRIRTRCYLRARRAKEQEA